MTPPGTDQSNRFGAMEDARISKYGLANLVGIHAIILGVFAVYVLTHEWWMVHGVPGAMWLMLGALPLVWIQFWVYIRGSEARLGGPTPEPAGRSEGDS